MRTLFLCSALLTVAIALPAQAERLSNGYLTIEKPLSLAVSTTPHNKEKFEAESKEFVDDLGQRAIKFISDENLDQTAKRNEFRKLLNDKFDLNTIGRFALGRYYRTATDAQKKDYFDLFKDMIVNVYSARFKEYSNEEFSVESARYDGKKDALVSSYIVPKSGPKVSVQWRVRLKNGKYQIVDVVVEGVSMSVTQRSEFSSIIDRGGGQVSALLDHMGK